MKRIGLIISTLFLLISSASAAGYNSEFKEAFNTNCVLERTEAECRCLVESLEEQIDQDDLITLYEKAAESEEHFEHLYHKVEQAKSACNIQ